MKKSLNDLALFGGARAFEEPLHVGKPNLGDRQRLMERIREILDRDWLTNDGPCVRELEMRIAETLGVKHCVAMCNGTVALEIAIRALGMTGEVIVPSFTFIATAHAVQWQGLTPVFCDVAPDTHTLDPRRVRERITPRTTGIIGVHLWGRPCEIAALAEIAGEYSLKLLFDAAHAFGCSRGGRMIGGFGHAEVFSFHATKVFNTFEGGAVTTDDDALAEKLRQMRNFGFAGYDCVTHIGTNGKMTEVCAAMGLTSLEALGRFIETNQRNYAEYRRGLAGIPGIALLPYPADEKANYQYVVIEVDPLAARLSRDALQQVLWAENVLARRYFYPGCHRMEPYKSLDPGAGKMLPVTETLSERVLCLPTGMATGPGDIGTITAMIRLAVENGPELHQRLQDRSGA
jgi:dTDP-4-amino-4,6-dideoxygalactose transaminase